MLPAKSLRFATVLAAALLGAWLPSRAFDFIRHNGLPITWWPGSVTIQVRMDTARTLQDGSNFASSSQAAMDAWNAHLGEVKLTAQFKPAGAGGDSDGVNDMFFAGDIYGSAFGENVLAVTTTFYFDQQRSDNTYPRAEADVIFNTAWTWDSYRGSLQSPEDFRRVAIHELGHLLGLDHPDEATPVQTVDAIMNSRAGHRDALAQDDIDGAQTLYGSNASVNRPANDSFASAVTLSSGSIQTSGTNIWATKEHGEPDHAPGERGGASIWWKWTAPSNGSLVVDTNGSDYDTLLAAYTGSSVGALTQLAANDDIEPPTSTPNPNRNRRSSVTINVTTGTTYIFAVDGWDGEMGNVTLNVAFTATNTDVAPYVIVHPTSTAVLEGSSATFSASAGGNPSPSPLWQVSQNNGASWEYLTDTYPYQGASTTTLTIRSTSTFMSGYQYRCIFMQSATSSVVTNPATLTVNTPPTIVSQPQDQYCALGGTAVFSVGGRWSAPVSFQWQKGGTDIPGATSQTLTLSNVQAGDAGAYRVIVTNDFGSASSSVANLVFVTPPAITVQPQDAFLSLGQIVGFSVQVSSQGPTSFQWFRNGSPIAGETKSYVSWYLGSDADFASVYVVVTNSAGMATSRTATVSASAPPAIVNSPENREVVEGTSVTLAVVASGAPPPNYQWQKNGVNIPGETGSSLSFASIGIADEGLYRVVVSNSRGSVTSNAGLVRVLPRGPSITMRSNARIVAAPGQTFTLNADVTGVGTQSFQWWRNGRVLTGASATTLSISNASYADGGWYQLEATDSVGTRRSSVVFVMISPNGAPVPVNQMRSSGYVASPLPTHMDTVALSAGSSHLLALRANGSIAAWGQGAGSEIVVPTDLTNVVGLGAGNRASFAILADGTVKAWGDGGVVTSMPQNLNGIVAVAAGDEHGLALQSDGTVVGWGGNSYGQSQVPPWLFDVVAISAYGNYSMALKSNGTVVTWGQLSGDYSSPPANLAGVVKIAAGGTHALALKGDGSVVGWGHFSTNLSATPPILTDAVSITAGMSQALAVRSNGSVVAWGVMDYTQDSPVADLNSAVSAVAGYSFHVVLRDASHDSVPTVSLQTASQTLLETTKFSLSATVSGPGPWSYQWRKNGTAIPNATSVTLVVDEISVSDAGDYDVVVTNYIGSSTSNTSTLLVTPLPQITLQSPISQVIAPGANATLAVTATGVSALSYQWYGNGRPISGATSPTLSLPSVTSRAKGWYFVVVTDANGSRRSPTFFLRVAPALTQIRSIGTTFQGSLNQIPAGVNDAVAIFGAGSHAVALRANGTLVAWGSNYNGETNVPGSLAQVVDVAAGAGHTVVLKEDGSVVDWSFYRPPANLRHVVAVAAGPYHGLALKHDGTVVAWGASNDGVLDIPPGLTNVVDIAAGPSYSLALKGDGSVVLWGQNYNRNIRLPTNLPPLTEISTSTYACLGRTNDGGLIGWGFEAYGQYSVPEDLGIPVTFAANSSSLALRSDSTLTLWDGFGNPVPPVPADIDRVFDLAATAELSLVLRDASADTKPVVTITPVSLFTEEARSVVLTASVSGGGPYTYQWRKDGTNLSGETAAVLTLPTVSFADAGSYDVVVVNPQGSTTSAATPLVVKPAPRITVLTPNHTQLWVGENFQLSVSASGVGSLSYQWYHDGQLIQGANAAIFTMPSLTVQDSGRYEVIVTDANGLRWSDPIYVSVVPSPTRVVCWGQNFNGTTNAPTLSDIVALSSFYWHTLGLRSNGTVVSWGSSNDSGEQNVPVGLGEVVAVAAGSSHSVALKADGTVVAWGWAAASVVPSGLANVVAIAAGGGHTLALRKDGTIAAWGNNSANQCNVPTKLNDVVAVAAGGDFSVALRRDGTVICWGNISAPSQASDIVAVSAGARHALGLKRDGTVIAWGSDVNQQLQVPANLTNVARIAAGWESSVCTLRDGHVVAWGGGSNSYAPYPAVLADVVQSTGGWQFWVALSGSPTHSAPLILTQPRSQTVSQGSSVQLTVSFSTNASCRWQRWPAGGAGWVDLTDNGDFLGTRTRVLSIPRATSTMSGDQFRCIVQNGDGSATSTAASILVQVATPTILEQPVSTQAFTGEATTFSIVADGLTPRAYQWQSAAPAIETWSDLANSDTISGATSPFLSLSGLTLQQDGLRFRCVVTNSLGQAISNAASLTVKIAPPTIDQPLQPSLVRAGSAVSLSISASGPAPLSYQWSLNDVDLPGATTSSLTIENFQAANAGTYSVRVTNAGGSFTSRATVSLATLPTITTQPQSVIRYAGENLTLSVVASSNAPLSYQWKKSGAPISGATQSTLQFSPLRESDAADYTVDVATIAGTVTSNVATLTVRPSSAPVITQQPLSQTTGLDGRVVFSVVASGAPAPTYRWQRLGLGWTAWQDLSADSSYGTFGWDGPNLVALSTAVDTNSGHRFRVLVSNAAGTVISNEATLNISGYMAPTSVAAGYTMTMAVRADGQTSRTGANYAGQFGDGTVTSSTNLLTPFGGPQAVVAAHLGFEHSLFVKFNGELWAAGDNQLGQLGDGSTTSRSTPVRIPGSYAGAAGGYRHSLFRTNEGRLLATGYNNAGQLGDGTTTTRNTPVQVATNVVAVAAGFSHSLFVKGDGTAYGMGTNNGLFGNGSAAGSLVPTSIATEVADVATFYHTAFLKRDGSVWTTGRNERGQLGAGDTVARLAATQVATNVVEIAVGALHTVLLKDDGTVWAFGANDRGQLGDGTKVDRSTPVQVASDVVSISAGLLTTTLVKSNGTLWAAGANDISQLGDGSTTDRAAFVQVASGQPGVPMDRVVPVATLSDSSDRVALTWNPSRGTTYYRVWRHTADDPAKAAVLAGRVKGTYFEDTSAQSGVTYFYWVQPVNQFGTWPLLVSAQGRRGTALVAPSISAQPISQTVQYGSPVAFSVVVTGSDPISYQWRKNDVDIPGATTNTFAIAQVSTTDAGAYSVLVVNGAGAVTSSAAVLTVNRLSQQITFAELADRAFPAASVALIASSSANLPVAFEVVSGPARIEGNNLTITGAGVVVIRASQAGSNSHEPAAPVVRSFTVFSTVVAWQSSHFTEAELLDAAISGPQADPDHDGIPNLVEYALGFDPRGADAPVDSPVAASETDWSYTYSRPSDRSDVIYRVEFSTDLVNWSPVTGSHQRVSTADGRETWTATQSRAQAPHCYFRLAVVHGSTAI